MIEDAERKKAPTSTTASPSHCSRPRTRTRQKWNPRMIEDMFIELWDASEKLARGPRMGDPRPFGGRNNGS